MSKISPVTQIAMKKHLEFKHSMYTQRKMPRTQNSGSLLLKSLVAIATITSAAILSNCTKDSYDTNLTSYLNSSSNEINKYFYTLGLFDKNSSEKITNIGFTDDNGYRHLLVSKKNDENLTKIQHLKINPDGNLTSLIELTITPEQDVINVDSYNYTGEFLHSKKYEASGDKIIEYSNYDGIFTPSSEFYKTENGFEQKLISGETRTFKNIKSNEKTPDTSIIVDEGLNEIIHEITLQ